MDKTTGRTATVLCASWYVDAAKDFTVMSARYNKINKRIDGMIVDVEAAGSRLELYIRNVSGHKYDISRQAPVVSVDEQCIEIFKSEQVENALREVYELQDDAADDEFAEDPDNRIEEVHRYLPDPIFSFRVSQQQRDTIGDLVEKHLELVSTISTLEEKLDEIEAEHDKLFLQIVKKIKDDQNIDYLVDVHETIVINVPGLKGPHIVICDQETAQSIVDEKLRPSDVEFDIYKGCSNKKQELI